MDGMEKIVVVLIILVIALKVYSCGANTRDLDLANEIDADYHEVKELLDETYDDLEMYVNTVALVTAKEDGTFFIHYGDCETIQQESSTWTTVPMSIVINDEQDRFYYHECWETYDSIVPRYNYEYHDCIPDPSIYE